MRTQRIGQSTLQSTRLVYGNMRAAGGFDPAKVTPDLEARARATMLAAFEAGYNHVDTADMYCRGVCERLLGQVLRDEPGLRQRLIITTKCGVRPHGDPVSGAPHRFDSSGEYILRACEGSLQRLGIDTVDILLLHRPDVLLPPEEVAAAFERLQRDGKVRHFGVSNYVPSMLAMLQSYLPMPLVLNQVQISPGRLEPFHDGTLDQCLQLRMSPQAWGPLANGRYGDGGQVPDTHPHREQQEKLLATLDEVAGRLGVGRMVVTLAWLLRHPAGILPVVGSSRPERLREAVRADSLDLSREDWYRIYVAAKGKLI